MKKLLALLFFMVVVEAPVSADSIAVRGSVDDFNTNENLDSYELAYIRDLPWAREGAAYRLQSQVELTAGFLDGGGETGLLGTIVPQVSFQQERVFLDFGAGIAVLSEEEFGRQDFGGSLQFIVQGGIGIMVTERIKAGLRVRHMSDAGIHDNGDDMNVFLAELRYDLE